MPTQNDVHGGIGVQNEYAQFRCDRLGIRSDYEEGREDLGDEQNQ